MQGSRDGVFDTGESIRTVRLRFCIECVACLKDLVDLDRAVPH